MELCSAENASPDPGARCSSAHITSGLAMWPSCNLSNQSIGRKPRRCMPGRIGLLMAASSSVVKTTFSWERADDQHFFMSSPMFSLAIISAVSLLMTMRSDTSSAFVLRSSLTFFPELVHGGARQAKSITRSHAPFPPREVPGGSSFQCSCPAVRMLFDAPLSMSASMSLASSGVSSTSVRSANGESSRSTPFLSSATALSRALA
mmetsp:Transcript_2437/g.9694  ORF Transcript_2437/g.9694 Transcript_2437/m.9694 type:complete len:205 (-) Transcript_2437:42-656(-)